MTRPSRRNPLSRLVLGVITLVAAVAVVYGVYSLGDTSSDADSNGAEAAAMQGLKPSDQARVSQLMEQFGENPTDVATITQLGDVFFAAGDYDSAGGWMEKAVALEPDNVKALLALGAAQFNLGYSDDAEAQWSRVIELDPGNVEAYYDLGFLYLSQDPPDNAKAKQMWRRVVELEPNSDVAKTLAKHLEVLKK